MKKLYICILMIVSTTTWSGEWRSLKGDYTKYVNPFVGTDFHGHTFPGATSPFGMVQLSPDTRLTGWDGCSGYHYSDSEIYGFSHTHLSGTGVADYCDILLMPVSGMSGNIITNEEYKSPFKKSSESATPGYYEVYLDKWGVKAQLTAGRRVGFHKYSYKRGAPKQLILDLSHRDELIEWEVIVGPNSLKGYRRSKGWAEDQVVYFYMEFSKQFSEVKLRDMKQKVFMEFVNDDNLSGSGEETPLMVKVGLSSVSYRNAKMNLDAEVAGWDFEKLRSETKMAWNEFLGKIEVEGGNQEQLSEFYTALYHTAIAPNLISDVNGEYRGMDRQIHKAEGYDHYTVFSLWDTYRTLHPLMTIIDKERTTHFIKSMLAMYQQCGKLPIWELAGNETNCMIGYHSVSVIADAYIKGIDGFDPYEALEAMVESSQKDEFGIRDYMAQGFVSADDEHESVSKTLEYAYDDWCIAQMALKLDQISTYNKYIKRAQSWRNILSPQTGFMQPRVNGGWLTPFEPSEVNVHFTEANSWQYSFYVPHDIETHIEMLGGDPIYISKLDSLFSAPSGTTGRTQVDITGLIGQYAHGNEPSHHAAYLYNYAGAPWKSQQMVRRIITELYSSAPDGLCGNDDCGQMSAWYVMSALGLYPVTPGDPTYIIISPIFKRATIHLENGHRFVIKSDGETYIQKALLNGTNYTKSYIGHSTLEQGGELVFETAPTPSYTFATAPQDRPKSKITAPPIALVPWFDISQPIFKDSTTVKLVSLNPTSGATANSNAISKSSSNSVGINTSTGATASQLKWRQAGTNAPFTTYTTPITIKHSVVLEGKDGSSPFISCSLRRIKSDWKIKIYTRYNPQYNAGGDEGLIDGIRGKKNFRLGGWQGYQNTDFTAVVDLGEKREIQRLGAGFLQDARSWIFMPKFVEFFISDDGENFELLGRVNNFVKDRDMEVQIHDLFLDLSNYKSPNSKKPAPNGQFIKIFAKNYGTIPNEGWHEGAGGEGFIFIDEIIIE